MKGLGLVALLVVIGILVTVWSTHTSQVAKTQKEVRPEVERMAGVDTNTGEKITETYKLETVEENGRFIGLKVVTLAPDSAMRSSYGLKENDVITEAGGGGGVMMSVRDTDAETLKTMVAQAYQLKQALVVNREGKQLTLTPGAKQPAPAELNSGSSLNKQLDAIKKSGQ
jgi:hypothetical protein